MVDVRRSRVARHTGISLAVMGALGGLALARAKPDELSANAAASKGNGVRDHTLLLRDFKRGQLETRFYTKTQIRRYYLKRTEAADKWLKIDDANIKFLKIDDANIKFLKIDDANIKFLKIDDANIKFLKIDDAYGKFLKIDGVAQDSNKLGGLDASQYVQGRASIIVGQAVGAADQGGVFLTIPGIVSFEAVPPGAQGGPTTITIRALGDGSVRVAGIPDGKGGFLTEVATKDTPIQGVLIGLNQPSMFQLLPAVQKLTTVTITRTDLGAGQFSWGAQAVVSP